MDEKILSEARKILKADDVKIVERLLGGMSNYTYIIEADGTLYTFRIPGEYSEHFVDRSAEIQNIRIVEGLKITNQTVYLNVENGIKIAKYVPGKPLSTLPESVYPYTKIAEVLKVLHNSNLKAVNDYEPFKRLTYYEKICTDLGFTHPDEYLKQKEYFYTFKDYLESQEKVLTHGDSQPSNFVLTDDDNLFIVDFEFCGNNDPIYDIACFSNKFYTDGLKLLEVYYPNLTDEHLLRFHLWRAFQCFQWYNVATFKEMVGMSKTLHIDFALVAKKYLEMIIFLLEKVKEIANNLKK